LIATRGAACRTGPLPSCRGAERASARSRRRTSLWLAGAIACAAATASGGQPSPAWVRFELDVPLSLVRAELERRAPRDTGTGRHVTLAEGFDLEIAAERDPLVVSGRGDTLVVRTRLRHSLHVAGEGLKRVGCGSETSPLSAEVVCTVRWGWSEDWGLEAIGSARGLNFARRCKPDPPRINLTKRAGPALHQVFVDPLLQAAAEVAASVRVREFVTAVWDAAATGLLLAEGWVDLAPDAVFVDPVEFTGEALAVRGAVRVRPQLRTGRPAGERVAFPAATPTRVRLSGGDFAVTVRVAADLSAARRRLQAAVDSVLAPGVRVEAMTLHPHADGVDVQIELHGDPAGPLAVAAALECVNHPPAIVARDASWMAATRQRLSRADARQRERLDKFLPVVSRATRIDLDDQVAGVTRDLGANLQRRLGDGLLLDGLLHDRRLIAVHGAGDSVSVTLSLGGHAVIRPLAANP
jgi:hypothetical protein